LPHVVADLHEMPSDKSYFTSTPPCPPINEHCSAEVRALWGIVGASVERHFAAQGSASFDGALYPLDYPGYGGSYNCMRGSAGMTYEQANPRGRSVRRNDGSMLTLDDAALHRATACLATLRACAARRDDILRTWASHFVAQKAASAADRLPVFLFPPTGDDFIDRAFRDVLSVNRLAASVLEEPLLVEVADLHGRGSAPRDLSEGDGRRDHRPAFPSVGQDPPRSRRHDGTRVSSGRREAAPRG
jgi:hypothetical protein